MSGVGENSSRQFSIDEIRKVTNGFNESRILGAGGYDRVYKGVIDDESTLTLVAVKRTLNSESKQGIRALETEIKLLSKCRHANLVNLLGYCNENQEMILVYEYMSRGNLADHLYGNKGTLLSWEQRLKICIGAARGLDYLHTGTGLSERIVHLDIKSDNILLDDDWAAKVADMGLSQIGSANKPNSHVNTVTLRGTQGYIDPEYSKTYTYSRKSDVYSFGVVMLEVLSGTSVWGGKIIPKFNLADWIQQHISKQTLDQIIDPRIVSKIQPGSLKRFVNTASKMLQLDPEKRPSMSSVVAKLESALEFQSSSPAVDKDETLEVRYQGETSRINSVPGLLGKEQFVFGEPIGDEEVVQRGLDPTRKNRALVAGYKYGTGSLTHVLAEFQEKLPQHDSYGDLKEKWGNVKLTLYLLYNATGETITYVTSRNHNADTAPFQYPTKIHNGQWGVYMRKENPMMPTAVVYRGRYPDNSLCDTMVTWSVGTDGGNTAFCDINEAGSFDVVYWDAIFYKAKFAGPTNHVFWKECFASVAIAGHTSPVCLAIFCLYGVLENYPI